MGSARRVVEAFLKKAGDPILKHAIRTLSGPSSAEIERDLAKRYGEIAEQMRGSPRSVQAPKEEPRAQGESEVEYCLKCIGENHLPKAITLLGEALKGSEGPRADKVSEAMGEIAAAEDHAKPPPNDEVRKLAEELRDIRKSLWPARSEGDTSTAESALSRLKAANRKLTELLGTPEVESAERETLGHLDKFMETGDATNLEEARKSAGRTGCDACVKYIQAAADALKEGNKEEANEWVRGVRRGIRVSMKAS